MKKIVLILLAGVLTLSAVEWDITQITDDPHLYSVDPILALDAQWQPHILYTEWNEEAKIILAYHDTDSWVFEEVAVVGENFLSYYSLDFDAEGNTYVAYSDFLDMGNSDIWVATDKAGDFSSVNVTDDEKFQGMPVMKLNQLGDVHLIYTEAETPDDSMSLRYGWVTEDTISSEVITPDISQSYYVDYDFVFKQGSIQIPQVFYIGTDWNLWHASPGELVWNLEKLNELYSEWPSAVADPLGSYHVAYEAWGGRVIRYITNMNGDWQDEEVISAVGRRELHERPCLDLETVYGGYLGIGNPHVVWMHTDGHAEEWWFDICYAGKLQGVWTEPSLITETDEVYEWPGYGRYFAVDVQGYGHLTFAQEDEEYVTQIYYVKSTEPLTTGVTEREVDTNPFVLEIRGSTIRFSLPESGRCNLDLYDASGRKVKRIASGYYPIGEHQIPFNTSELSSGVYFVRTQAERQSASVKFVVTR